MSRSENNRMAYEIFHRDIIKEKMKIYKNDVIRYFKEEWGCTDDMALTVPETNSDDFKEYDEIETQFIKQFFSIKA